MEEGILDINKVDIPVEDHGDVEIDPECCAPDYCRLGSFLGVKLLLEATDDLAGLISSSWLYVIDPLASKDPKAFGDA